MTPSRPRRARLSSRISFGNEQSCALAACILVPHGTWQYSSSPDGPQLARLAQLRRASSLRPVVHDVVWCRSSDIPAPRQCHPAHRHWSCSSIRRIRSTMVRPLPGLVPQHMCGSVQAPSPERARPSGHAMVTGIKGRHLPRSSQSWETIRFRVYFTSENA